MRPPLDNAHKNYYYYIKEHAVSGESCPHAGLHGRVGKAKERAFSMRYSRQRELVLRQVQSRCDHPTADDIYLSIRDDCPGLSLGTVYRNLNGLVEMGRVRRVSMPGMADRFDRTLADHDHLYCTCCGRVEDVQLDKTAIEQAIASRPDLSIQKYSLSLYGVCSACREAARS